MFQRDNARHNNIMLQAAQGKECSKKDLQTCELGPGS